MPLNSRSVGQTRMHAFRRRWEAFGRRPFPAGFAGVEIDGVCLATVDSGVAGCLDTFVDNGWIDSKRQSILARSSQDLARVLPKLEGEPASYFGELVALAELALRRTRD